MRNVDMLRSVLAQKNIAALFVTRETNLRYLSGFTGADSFGLITEKDFFFITDRRYTEQAERECPECTMVPYRTPYPMLPQTLKNLCEAHDVQEVHFEKEHISWNLAEKIRETLGSIVFSPSEDHVDILRQVKTPEEIEHIRAAAHIADRAFYQMLSYIKPGLTEKDVETELAYRMKKLGSEDLAFPIITASGPNSSLPHAVPGSRKLEKGDFLTLDFGAMVEGYRSDMTRTVVLGRPSEKQKKVYRTVFQAQEAAMERIKDGFSGKEADALARKVLEIEGYTLQHGLGHGVGLDIHEKPFMGLQCEQNLKAGNVITVEPGIYIPGWGGVRIEEIGVVTSEGYERLNTSPRELIEL